MDCSRRKSKVDEDTWQNDDAPPAWKVERQDQFDRYLADEVTPFIRDKSGRKDLIVYGASFGGYHATNFSLRHPEVASRLVVFSGVFDIHKFLHGFWNDTCYFHCPTAYVPNYDDEWVGKLKDLGIVLATGEHDTIVQNTRDFSALLESKGIMQRDSILCLRLSESRRKPSTVSGVATLTKRAASTSGIASAIKMPISPVKLSAMTSKPISRNSAAFMISSISDQNLWTWSRVVSLIAKRVP